MAEGEWKYPPSGVPSEPVPTRSYVALKDAARRLHMDRRTLQATVVSGEIQGWARPGPQRLRWYVYEDQLAQTRPDAPAEIALLRAEVAELRAELAQINRARAGGVDPARVSDEIREELRAEASRAAESVVADLRADIVTLTETNLLLLEAQEDLGGVVSTMDGVAQKYRRALGLFMTPGHPGEMSSTPPVR